jgi:hypothetical protein
MKECLPDQATFCDGIAVSQHHPKFVTETGFVQRVDQRSINQYGHFYFRRKSKHLIFHGARKTPHTVVEQPRHDTSAGGKL